MKDRIKYIISGILILFLLSLMFRWSVTWTSVYTFEFGFKVPEVQNETSPTQSEIPEKQEVSDLEDQILSYIQDIKVNSANVRTLFDTEKANDFLEKDLYCNNLFTVTWKGNKKDKFRAYTISRDGTKTLVQEPWSASHYIHSPDTYKSYHVICCIDNVPYIPVQQENTTSPFGTVWVYYLYPLEDCYLSYIGQIRTKYNPSKFEAFTHFVDLAEYKFLPYEELA